jgi:hypothetical protein
MGGKRSKDEKPKLLNVIQTIEIILQAKPAIRRP